VICKLLFVIRRCSSGEWDAKLLMAGYQIEACRVRKYKLKPKLGFDPFCVFEEKIHIEDPAQPPSNNSNQTVYIWARRSQFLSSPLFLFRSETESSPLTSIHAYTISVLSWLTWLCNIDWMSTGSYTDAHSITISIQVENNHTVEHAVCRILLLHDLFI
jgi:hypothetical protein